MLPVGVRPPIFPDEQVDEPPAPTPAIPPEVKRSIDGWVDSAADDIERRCRSLRRTSIRHAITLDGIDTGAVVRHLALTEPASVDLGRQTPIRTAESAAPD